MKWIQRYKSRRPTYIRISKQYYKQETPGETNPWDDIKSQTRMELFTMDRFDRRHKQFTKTFALAKDDKMKREPTQKRRKPQTQEHP